MRLRGEIVRKLIVALTVSVILVSLGYNTLDWLTWHPMQQIDGMAWRFDYQPVWHLNSWLSLDIWNAYFFAGILPLALGSALFGLSIAILWLHSKEE